MDDTPATKVVRPLRGTGQIGRSIVSSCGLHLCYSGARSVRRNRDRWTAQPGQHSADSVPGYLSRAAIARRTRQTSIELPIDTVPTPLSPLPGHRSLGCSREKT